MLVGTAQAENATIITKNTRPVAKRGFLTIFSSSFPCAFKQKKNLETKIIWNETIDSELMIFRSTGKPQTGG
jgi:hypothetical protein